MQIKRLELVGFKSFVDKTIIEVPPGITGIVGPNGCGKSNIVDAIRWVLGEQSSKNLRGKSMEDVIFNGSENRVPTGMAEVNVTFDNRSGRLGGIYSSYSEISVGRRLFRSGESEYLINRNVVRLKDIQEIFMDTGVGPRAHYSIIEQGKIGMVLSAKAEDRRILIEEAAGISKYRVRKEAALRRIESTQQNLLRITDVIGEVKRQMEYTRRQAQKAQKHVEVKNEIVQLEGLLWKHDYRREHEGFRAIETHVEKLSREEQALAAQISGLETELERKRLELVASEKAIQEIQEALYAQQSRTQLLEKDKEHNARGRAELSERQGKLSQTLQKLRNELEGIRRQRLESKETLTKATEREALGKQELHVLDAHLAETQAELNAKRHDIEDGRNRLNRLVLRRENLKVRREHLAQRCEELKNILARTAEEETHIERTLQTLRQNVKKIEEKMADVRQLRLELQTKTEASQESFLGLDRERGALDERIFKGKEDLAALRSRLRVLQELQSNYDGLKQGVRSIMLRQKSAEGTQLGIVGLVAELITLPKDIERAAEAVLGERLQYIVVESQDRALESVAYLNEKALGRGTFIPRELRGNAAAENSALLADPGVVGALLDFVKAAPGSENIVKYLMKDVIVVRTLADAVRLWQLRDRQITWVTLDGEVLDALGSVTGGRTSPQEPDAHQDEFESSAGFLQRKRLIGDLDVESRRMQERLVEEEKASTALAEKFSHSRATLESLQKDSHERELRLVEFQKELQQAREESERLQANLNQAREQKKSQESTLQGLLQETDATQAEFQSTASEEETLAQHVQTAKADEEKLQAGLDDVKGKTTALQVNLAEIREQVSHREAEYQRLGNEIHEHEEQVLQFEQDFAAGLKQDQDLAEKNLEAEQELAHLLSESHEVENHLQAKRAAYEGSFAQVSEAEKTLKDRRHQVEQGINRLSQEKMQMTEAKMRLERLEFQIKEAQKIDIQILIDEALSAANTVTDDGLAALDESRARLESLRSQLAGMGDVNIAAIAELEEFSQRHVFLNRQKEDLDQSIDSLQKTIQKVNRTSRELFQETFNAVNGKFQVVFPRLFGGGKASLFLTDEANLLETGVEILCQPPGKKIQNVTLLSGGEKALASICLILAIFLIKPSPFCLLDEVDAPLDDANISRFNDLLHELAKESQLLLITHNRHTMEIADHLYGVTMEEPGVSRMVSVRMH